MCDLCSAQLHPDVIRDITFLHNSWPFVKSHQSALLSLSCQGIVKVWYMSLKTISHSHNFLFVFKFNTYL